MKLNYSAPKADIVEIALNDSIAAGCSAMYSVGWDWTTGVVRVPYLAIKKCDIPLEDPTNPASYDVISWDDAGSIVTELSAADYSLSNFRDSIGTVSGTQSWSAGANCFTS